MGRFGVIGLWLCGLFGACAFALAAHATPQPRPPSLAPFQNWT